MLQRDKLNESRQYIFNRTNQLIELARRMFPGGEDCATISKLKAVNKVDETKALLLAGNTLLYDASFQHNGVVTTLDILQIKDGNYYGFEIKSSSRITSNHIMDAALQYYVLSNNGVFLSDFTVMTLNPFYHKKREIEPELLFMKKSVFNKILPLQEFISSKLAGMHEVISQNEAPVIHMSEHCHSPHSCDFIENCRGDIESDSILYLQGASRQTVYELFHAGVRKIGQVPIDFNLSAEQKIQYSVIQSGAEYIDKKGLSAFFEKVHYPIHYLDFEMFMPAVPLFEGNTPYQHLPFLYSIHRQNSSDGTTEHTCFLAPTGSDPTEKFIYQLLLDLGDSGSIFVFDATHERRILNKAAGQFPRYKNSIHLVLNRIIDLSLPFQNKLYYHQEMKGSYSMKTLLPIFAPNLSFDVLKIKNGMEAMLAFEQMHESDEVLKQELSEALIDYCKMDTFGLVKIAESLMLKSR